MMPHNLVSVFAVYQYISTVSNSNADNDDLVFSSFSALCKSYGDD